MTIGRARLIFVASIAFALAVLIFELPISQILHQRSSLGSAEVELTSVDSRNSSLQADIKALSQNATITAIAHEEYGLVRPGQRSYVILPSAGSGSSSALSTPSIPPQDLVAAPASEESASQSSPSASTPGFWNRFASKLAFWRWAF